MTTDKNARAEHERRAEADCQSGVPWREYRRHKPRDEQAGPQDPDETEELFSQRYDT